jgi:uncharacterized repeat protein (TIGR04138 family)
VTAAQPVLDKIRADLIDSGRDTRYQLGAYLFVLNGLEFHLVKVGEKRHVSGQELSRGLVEFAVRQFGPLAYRVLEYWGIRATDDLGYLVYNLIDIGLMSKQESDQLGDFFDVFDIREYCLEKDRFVIDKEHVRTVRGA